MTKPLLTMDLDHVLEKTVDLWDELRCKRIFLTGGTGFFGCWLLESYLRAWERFDLQGEILVLTRNAGKFSREMPRLASHRALTLVEGDQTQFTISEGDLSHIIHAAVEYGNPRTTLENNFHGMSRVLQLAATRKTERFLFTSSGAVYGPQPLDIEGLVESSPSALDPTATQSAYGEMKRASELLGCLYGEEYGFRFCIARCFAFAGPYLDLNRPSAFGNFIRDSLNGDDIHVKGDGTPLRSYLYAADLAIWLWTLLLRGEGGRAYNVGSDVAFPLIHVANQVALTNGAKVLVATPDQGAGHPNRYIPNIDRARTELGLKPWIGLEESIRRTKNWHLGLEGER